MASDVNRLHPFSALRIAFRRGFLGFSAPIFFGMIAASIFPIDLIWALRLSPIGFIVGVCYGLTYYYQFTYEITSDTFDITSGVFARRSREIPYRRIQNVDVSQRMTQRLLGLAVVSIETAGDSDAEAMLDLVDEDEADRIRTEIRRQTAAAGTTDDADGAATTEPSSGADSDDTGREETARPDREPTLLFELKLRELLLYAVSSFRWDTMLFPLLLFLWITDGDLRSALLPQFMFEIARPFGGPASLDGAAGSALVVLLVIALIQWALLTYLASILYKIGNYYGLRLGRQGSDLVYERGLGRRYSGSIPFDKVQSVTVTDNPVQRLMGYAGLWVETAGYGPRSGGSNQSVVPLADASRVSRFGELLTGIDRPEFRRPPTTARRRYFARYSLVATGVVAGAFAIAQLTTVERWRFSVLAFAAVPLAAHLKYAHLGYVVGDEHLVIRRGFWRRRTTIVPYYRIQTVSTRRSIFQRRLGLASLVVDTASSRTFTWRTPVIYDIELERTRDIHCASREHLQRSLREHAHRVTRMT
ncbi:membrane-flanked domain protein [Haloterrigena salina JCM 13891]|uniref:Membrane-flanked domain protein n=1 Tax=Haloterrigena salina JCM 13891 TaxID=1227488 RepID=M0CHU6_9EURY|nr:PH domain-containing protein [Haloterrigena salina]ELZ22811.1 membrane-flanked domain protein [Haloterrigena salina JCM 13891]